MKILITSVEISKDKIKTRFEIIKPIINCDMQFQIICAIENCMYTYKRSLASFS